MWAVLVISSHIAERASDWHIGNGASANLASFRDKVRTRQIPAEEEDNGGSGTRSIRLKSVCHGWKKQWNNPICLVEDRCTSECRVSWMRADNTTCDNGVIVL